MAEEGSERKKMSEEERRMMEENEKTSEVWTEEKIERHERASADLLKGEAGETVINPPSAGGKILEGTQKGTAAGARCGYPSKPCDR